MRSHVGVVVALVGAGVCAGGLALGHAYAPTLEWRDLRFEWTQTASAPGAVVSVDQTTWEMPAKREGMLPLPVFRVTYRYGLDDGRNFDGASYSTGLFHRVRDTVTVQYLVSDPSISRAYRTTLAPRGPLGLLPALLPVLGLLLVAGGAALAFRARSKQPQPDRIPADRA